MSGERKDPFFFIGYLPMPRRLRPFMATVALAAVASFVGAGWMVAISQDDPGQGAFRYDYGRQTVQGIVEMTPYPVLRVTQGNDRIEPGHSLMLSGGGIAPSTTTRMQQ